MILDLLATFIAVAAVLACAELSWPASMRRLEAASLLHFSVSVLSFGGVCPWWLACGTYALCSVVATGLAREHFSSMPRRSPMAIAAVLMASFLWPWLAISVAYRRGSS